MGGGQSGRSVVLLRGCSWLAIGLVGLISFAGKVIAQTEDSSSDTDSDTLETERLVVKQAFRAWVAPAFRLSAQPAIDTLKPPAITAHYRTDVPEYVPRYRYRAFPPLVAPGDTFPEGWGKWVAMLYGGSFSSVGGLVQGRVPLPEGVPVPLYARVGFDRLATDWWGKLPLTQWDVYLGSVLPVGGMRLDVGAVHRGWVSAYPVDTGWREGWSREVAQMQVGDASMSGEARRLSAMHWRVWARTDVSLGRDTLNLGGEGWYFVRRGWTELYGRFRAEGSRWWKNRQHRLGVATAVEAMTHGGFVRRGTFFWQIHPYYEFRGKGGFLLHIGIQPVVGDTFYLLPALYSHKNLVGNRLVYYTMFTGWVDTRPLAHVFAENPWFSPDIVIRPTDALVTKTGLRVLPVWGIQAEVSFAYRRFRWFPVWMPDIDTVLRWHLVYDSRADVLTFSGVVEGRWQDYVWGLARFALHDYRLRDTVAFHYPVWQTDFIVDVRPIRLLVLRVSGMVWGARPVWLNQKEKVGMSLSGEVQVRLHRVVFLWLRAENLLNQRYVLWYPYRAWGMRWLVGLRARW